MIRSLARLAEMAILRFESARAERPLREGKP
jgi:hypothetical protein